MEIKEIQNKEVWEGFLSGVENKTFLQSWQWGEFQKKIGERVWRFGVYDKEQLVSVSQVILISARRGKFLLVPHAPIKEEGRPPQNMRRSALLLLERIKELAKQEKSDFVRVAPICGRNQENEKMFRDLGFRRAGIHIHPELTWILDITKPEQELLADMRKTTRYLIKQGSRDKDLEIVKSADVKDIEKFNEIYKTTSSRHHFTPFSLNYLKNEFLSFLPDNTLIFSAKYKGETIAGAVIIFWQRIGFYHQGASSQKYPKIPASYVLQWEAIREAKNRGCKLYNFWGIADVESEQELKNHPWKGLTLFKKGFGGKAVTYLKTQDLPLTKRYWLIYIFEKLRKIKRGF